MKRKSILHIFIAILTIILTAIGSLVFLIVTIIGTISKRSTFFEIENPLEDIIEDFDDEF